MTTMVLEEATSGRIHVVEVSRLLVIGFAGRDEAAVAEHIAELAAEGVPVPASTPTVYSLEPGLARQTSVVAVAGANSSGEVEPVVVVTSDGLLLTVGSDHTDRDLEREDIARSKAACAKVVGSRCVPVADIDDWDGIGLESRVDDDVLYQHGTLAALQPLERLVDHLRDNDLQLRPGDVVFLGTVPTEGGIRPSRRFSAVLRAADVELELSYEIIDLSSSGRVPSAKPEIEFTQVDETPWVPVPGSPGLTERILAADPSGGTATRMLQFEPGADTRSQGVLRHDFWEEVYIIAGELHDLTLDRVFGAGTYACRPPGMPHGPWRSDPGCVTFEVRYPAS